MCGIACEFACGTAVVEVGASVPTASVPTAMPPIDPLPADVTPWETFVVGDVAPASTAVHFLLLLEVQQSLFLNVINFHDLSGMFRVERCRTPKRWFYCLGPPMNPLTKGC